MGAIKWMSRDKDGVYSNAVHFWSEEPDFNGDQFDPNNMLACCGFLPVSLVPNAPQAGLCVPVGYIGVINVVVLAANRDWLARDAIGQFWLYRSPEPPAFDEGHFEGPGMVQGMMSDEFVSRYLWKNHGLQLGECREMPPR